MKLRELVKELIEFPMEYQVVGPQGECRLLGVTYDYDNKLIRMHFKEEMYTGSQLNQLMQRAVDNYKLIVELEDKTP